MTEIHSNGSKWCGKEPDTIEQLCEVLKEHTLDPEFEKLGNFVNHNPQWIKPNAQEKYAGCTQIFGNFYTCSHVFNITTDDAELIARLEKLIRENQSTEAYLKAKELIA